MTSKLKTYITSEGFFDKATAAPSMKAALEAWGTSHNLFHQGFAKESDDPVIIAATMERPGVVLRRPVGSNAAFEEHAQLPRSIVSEETLKVPETQNKRPLKKLHKSDREATKAFVQEQKRRKEQRRKEETLRKKIAQKREVAVAKARSALNDAEKKHDKEMATLEVQHRSINDKLEKQKASWDRELKRLEAALNKAKDT